MSSVAQRSLPVNGPVSDKPSGISPVPKSWVRTPRDLNTLNTLTPLQERIWNRINAATQTRMRNGQISVPELMHYAQCSESTVYRALRALKRTGLIYSLVTPGKAAVYYLPWNYAGPKLVTPTPVTDATPTPVTPDRGAPYRREDKVSKTTTSERAMVSARDEKPVADDWTERVLRNIEANGIGMNPDELLNLWG